MKGTRLPNETKSNWAIAVSRQGYAEVIDLSAESEWDWAERFHSLKGSTKTRLDCLSLIKQWHSSRSRVGAMT